VAVSSTDSTIGALGACTSWSASVTSKGAGDDRDLVDHRDLERHVDGARHAHDGEVAGRRGRHGRICGRQRVQCDRLGHGEGGRRVLGVASARWTATRR
jgi:hypothetical protein